MKPFRTSFRYILALAFPLMPCGCKLLDSMSIMTNSQTKTFIMHSKFDSLRYDTLGHLNKVVDDAVSRSEIIRSGSNDRHIQCSLTENELYFKYHRVQNHFNPIADGTVKVRITMKPINAEDTLVKIKCGYALNGPEQVKNTIDYIQNKIKGTGP